MQFNLIKSHPYEKVEAVPFQRNYKFLFDVTETKRETQL